MEMEKVNMDSLVTVMAAVEKLGFRVQFEVTPNGLKSLASRKEFRSDEVKIVRIYRFEGESDPDDSSILYALQTNDHERGTLVDGYGISADSVTANFMKTIQNLKMTR